MYIVYYSTDPEHIYIVYVITHDCKFRSKLYVISHFDICVLDQVIMHIITNMCYYCLPRTLLSCDRES